MKTIVCVDENWAIGKNNELLFHLPKDLAFFKEKTENKIVVMGGNTFLSLPNSRPLPNRKNIVLTDIFTRDDCTVVETLKDLEKELLQYDSDDIFIIGGAMFYTTMLDYCDTAYITKVKCRCNDATVFFPNLDSLSNWEMTEAGNEYFDGQYKIQHCIYKNNKVVEFGGVK